MGYLIVFCGCLAAFRIKYRKDVTLRLTEIEYAGLIKLSCKIFFIRDVLIFLGIVIDLPTVIKFENAGAIYLANKKAME